ncbi:hypothetical protein ACUN9Y_00705 [Halomonas sp. V046]|uniref:hypothetical protein n=1 Tax=Halomonas sp. V046 TaxID=3459611 RepID=UPI0040447099
MTITTRTAMAALGLSLLPGLAHADAEQLEADLRGALAGEGELTIGDVSDALLGGSTTAEELSFSGTAGEKMTVARYIVEGDYDDPDEVILEGVSMIEEGTNVKVERLVFDSPGQAVLDLGDLSYSVENPLEGLSLEGLVLDQVAGMANSDLPFGVEGGRIELQSLSATDLSDEAIGSLTLSGLTGSGDNLGDLGAGTFSLPSLSLSGLTGMDTDSPTMDALEFSDLDIATEKLVATLGHLVADGNMEDGEYSGSMEALNLDLAKMIELAPAEERTNLRLVSNVLTGGSGQLSLDADMDGTWEADGANGQMGSRFSMTAADAFRFAFDSDVPVQLPKGQDPAEYFAGIDDWTELNTLGGELSTTLSDLGVFARIAPVVAATQGMSEGEFLEQARTQAEGFGIMMGPKIGEVLSGIVSMMAGEASEMSVHVNLPPSAEFQKLAQDPLGLPEALSMQVDVE